MRSGSTSNDTFWPSTRVRRPDFSIAEMCTNTSLAPPSGVMKPKPLVVLKNFTVPVCAMGGSLLLPNKSVTLRPYGGSAKGRWRIGGRAFGTRLKPPAKGGFVRDSRCRGKGRQNVQSPGQQMPEHEIYRTEM